MDNSTSQSIPQLDLATSVIIGMPVPYVPFMGPQMHDHAMTVAQVPARKYYWDAELLVAVQMAVERWYGFDCTTVIADAYNFEVEALGAKMIYSDIAMPTVDTNHPLIKERADLDKLGALDPSKGRIPMAVEAARLVCQKASGPFAAGFFCSPFSFLCQAMGYPKAVRALKRDKVFAQELFDYAENQAIFPFLKAQSQQGVKSSVGADAWACFPDLSPQLIEEWVVPSAQRMAARGQQELGMRVAAGVAAADYCEEDPAKFNKEIMFECWRLGSMLLQGMVFGIMGRTQDWNINWVQEFALKNKLPDRKLPILIGVNARFTRDSTPEQIVAKVREWINIAGRDGGLLLMIGNIPADTPPINVHTAVHATHTLGKYPIEEDLNAVKVDIPSCQPFDQWLRDQPEADIIFKAREK